MPTLIRSSIPVTVRSSGPPITIRPRAIVHVTPRTVIEVSPVPVTAVTITPVRATPIIPIRPETVRPPDRGAWDERGWTRRREGNDEIYEGHYQVGDRRFRGKVKVGRRHRIEAFIYDPPREIRRHRHHACFQQIGIGTGWYVLHWQRSPRNVDEALLYFEQILDESINNR